jgi:hypothetical protein
MYQVRATLEKILDETTGRSGTPTLLPAVELWVERALRINSALLFQQ